MDLPKGRLSFLQDDLGKPRLCRSAIKQKSFCIETPQDDEETTANENKFIESIYISDEEFCYGHSCL